MGVFSNNLLTKLTGIFILSVVLFSLFTQKKWNEPDEVITSDVRGYYAYLPALFIHDDIRIEHPEKFEDKIWFVEDEDGTRAIKYTYGMSLLYSPFFFVAHALAEPIGAQPDGYSYPYKFALVMSSVFYLIIGLLFLSKFLLLYFKDSTVAVTLLLLYLGTNVLYYYTLGMTFSHGYSFALLSVFMYCSVRWLMTPSFRWAFWIGISAGILVLVRPIDLVFLLFLLLFNVSVRQQSIMERLKLFWNNWKQVLVMITIFILMLVPQFVYYYSVSGSVFRYPYTGESFFFFKPHIFDSIFSYRNGWMVYSPLMIFAIVGLFFLKHLKSKSALFVLSVVCIYIYIISSWWCWWYVGFGNRAFINLYPILSIPLACFIQYVLSKKLFQRLAFKLVALAGIILSVFQIYQTETEAIHWGAMTKDAYWDSFGREKPSQLFYSYLHYPVDEKVLKGIDAIHYPKEKTIYSWQKSFDKITPNDSVSNPFFQRNNVHSGRGALFIPKENLYALLYPLSVKNVNRIYVTAWVKSHSTEGIYLSLGGGDSIPFYASSDEVNQKDQDWSQIHLYATIPDNFGLDRVNLYIYNEGGMNFWLDDLRVTASSVKYIEKERR